MQMEKLEIKTIVSEIEFLQLKKYHQYYMSCEQLFKLMDKEKEKNGGGNEQTSLELWNHIKRSNIHRSVAPEEVERE